MKGKKILVTGGAGFIGSHLAHAFCRDNEVIVIDDLSTGKTQNIKQLVDSKRVEFVMGSITDVPLMKKVSRNVDFIFHHAAQASVPKSVKDPASTNDINITGTLSTLLAARDGGARKLVFASSAAIYGNPDTLPIREDFPMRPESPYAVTKIVGEEYCRLFDELYGLKTVSLRYFNVFGPRQSPESEYASVIPRFMSYSLVGKSLPIHGDGKQTRDFIFIADVVEANKLAAESKAVGSFNIASGLPVSINELADIVKALTHSRSKIVHGKTRKGDIEHSVADVKRSRKLLGFEQKYTLERGLSETFKSLEK